MANKSVMAHTFSEVPRAEIPRSSFDRSCGLKTTFDADFLVPIFCDDVVPGDTFRCNTTFFARLATPLHPIMDNIYLETFWFFVPYRLVWENWERFCGAQDDPADSIDYEIPGVSTSTTAVLTNFALCDYFGLPYVGSADGTNINALPFRAYNLIYNEWFRDQNLQDSALVDLDDGPDSLNNYSLRKRGKRHDYFTSCLPWPQKGGNAIDLPLGETAPVFTQVTDAITGTQTALRLRDASGGGLRTNADVQIGTTSGQFSAGTSGLGGGNNAGIYPSNLYADLSTATAATINDLRLAFQTQRLLERDARAGTRYTETIKAHFGVTVPDFRVQRPEFLGGGSTRVNMTPVANTSADGTSNQGDLTAFGTAGDTHGWTKSFTEHGCVIGLVNARSDITYSEGMLRYWSKKTRYEFYYPVLAQIGEQAVLNSEIYYQNTAADDNVFGYQERYAEYRYKPSQITGRFRSNYAQSLESWHLSEEFGTLPTLGADFIRSNTGDPLDRAIAVATEPHFIADFHFQLQCARPMPLYGVPGNIDRF